ncbi:hypothetical protein B0H13DRAFT_2371514 [Mycena leptocephala]|nr:hypothetical protein B0H13DRAFT_2371514 [Mycena leptocephala]
MLSLLAGAFSKLDTKWCSILVHRGNARGSTACPDPALLLAEPEDSLDDSDSDTHAEFVAGKIEGTSIEFEELFLSVLKLDPLLQLEEIGAVASGLPALD